MSRVLVVEDEVGLCEAVVKGLQDHGFAVDSAHDGFEGYRMARSGDFDVVILDWMLPRLPGDEISRRLRADGVDTPILMVTAKDGISDETGALDAGADDYLRKPFEFAVLAARCDALLRRQRGPWSELVYSELALDPRRRIARVGAERISLSRRETEVLEYLLRAAGELRTKEDMLREVWGGGPVTDSNSVESYIRYLRRKLEPAAGRRIIETVRGAGYRLLAS